MKQTPDITTYSIVFIAIGVIFGVMGFTTPIFFAVGAAFIVIGLVSVLRERRKGQDRGEEDLPADMTSDEESFDEKET